MNVQAPLELPKIFQEGPWEDLDCLLGVQKASVPRERGCGEAAHLQAGDRILRHLSYDNKLEGAPCWEH